MKELDRPSKPSKPSVAEKQVEEARHRPPPSDEVIARNIEKCEQKIRGAMKDPDAAKVGDGRRSGPALQYVKGHMKTYAGVSYMFKVNGKNSYGAYTGNKLYSCVLDLDEKEILQVHELGPYPG